MPNNKSIDKKNKLKKEREERRIIRLYRGTNNLLLLSVTKRHVSSTQEEAKSKDDET
jgi:hypothetical protein